MVTSSEGRKAYELSVDGSLGPVLRTALHEHGYATFTACTVIQLEEPEGCGLVDALDACESAGLEVREIRLVHDPAPGRSVSARTTPRG